MLNGVNNLGEERKGGDEGQVTERIKEKRWSYRNLPVTAERKFWTGIKSNFKSLIRYPLVRGKNALEPNTGFRNIQTKCIPCSWRLEKNGKKGKLLTTTVPQDTKIKRSHHFSESLLASYYIWLHTHINTHSFTVLLILLQRYPYCDKTLP